MVEHLFNAYQTALNEMKEEMLEEEKKVLLEFQKMDKKMDELSNEIFHYDMKSLFFA